LVGVSFLGPDLCLNFSLVNIACAIDAVKRNQTQFRKSLDLPSNARSLQLTDAYRRRLVSLAERVERVAREAWPTIDGFDTTDWVDQMAAQVARAQVEGIRLTAGYIGAFIRSETGHGRTPAIDSRKYVGISRDGRPLREALVSPLIGVRAALKQGLPSNTALRLGLVRGTRMVGFEAMQTPREALVDAIKDNDQLSGFQRSVAGTCAACMALSGVSAPHFEVHPNCQCVPMPTVLGAANTFPLPTGAALFRELTPEKQAAAVGPEAAELIRDGHADLKDFVSHSSQAEQADFITQKPVDEVQATPTQEVTQ
jgi:hypothetical protein